MILSVSRRTDIPAFYGEWFFNRLRAGAVLVRNPMNPHQISRIPLTPEALDCMVFWTKNPAPMLSRLDELDGFGVPYLFQFTLTPYGRTLEPGLPPKEQVLETFQALSRRLGPERVLWRCDPIVLNQEWDIPRHIQAFRMLCQALRGYTSRCTISFVDAYGKLRSAYRQGLLREISPGEMKELGRELAAVGAEAGIPLQTCCEAADLTGFGIASGSCIDRKALERLCGYPITAKPDNAQRPGCGCLQSVDIGAYDTCRHGCIYCYACGREPQAHDPASPLLAGTLAPEDRVTDRRIPPVSRQLSR